MSAHASQREAPQPADDAAVRALCRQLWDSWNSRDSERFAAAFAEDGEVIGFDGSQQAGREAIEALLRQIFADHKPAAYIGAIRSVRLLAPDVAILKAVVGMVPPGAADINPQVNAVQVLVATREAGEWRIASFQNTPAQLHGRPDLVEQLNAELRRLL